MKAILDKSEIKKLKNNRARGMTFDSLAKKYKVSKTTAYKTAVSISKLENEYTKKADKSISDIKAIKNSICVDDKLHVIEDRLPRIIMVKGKTNNYFYGKNENGFTESFTWNSVYCGDVPIQKN